MGFLGTMLESTGTKLLGDTNDAWKNLKANTGKVEADFSNGNILHGLGDTYRMTKDPTGSWGSSPDKTFKPTDSFQLDSSHLSAPDANGMQKITDDGIDALMKHAQATGGFDSPGSQTPDESQGQDQSQHKQGLISRLGHSLIGGL